MAKLIMTHSQMNFHSRMADKNFGGNAYLGTSALINVLKKINDDLLTEKFSDYGILSKIPTDVVKAFQNISSTKLDNLVSGLKVLKEFGFSITDDDISKVSKSTVGGFSIAGYKTTNGVSKSKTDKVKLEFKWINKENNPDNEQLYIMSLNNRSFSSTNLNSFTRQDETMFARMTWAAFTIGTDLEKDEIVLDKIDEIETINSMTIELKIPDEYGI